MTPKLEEHNQKSIKIQNKSAHINKIQKCYKQLDET